MTSHSYTRSLVAIAALAMVISAVSPALAQEHRSGDHHRSATAGARQTPPVISARQGITPRVVVSGRANPSHVYRTISPVVIVGRTAPRIVDLRGPRVSLNVAPLRFYRPYYVFRPRVHIGAGFFIGFPVAYAYGYYDVPYYDFAYGYPYPTYPAYGYPAPGASYPPYPYPPQAYPPSTYPAPAAGSVVVQPGQVDTGGASFEITPNTAEVLVDGVLMGPVSQFTPMTAPLGLTPGHHHFEVRAPGYQTIAFDADIVAGQVTPFQGTMQR